MTPEPVPNAESALLDPAALRIPITARHSEQRKTPATAAIAIRRPANDEWAYVNPNSEFHFENFWCYEKDKKVYMITPTLYPQLEVYVARVFAEWDFYLAAVKNDDPVIWPVKHSDTDYFRTQREAVQAAMTGWYQIQSNQALKRYDYRPAHADYPTPDWTGFETTEDARALFTKTFRNSLITSLDHDVLERLRGRK